MHFLKKERLKKVWNKQITKRISYPAFKKLIPVLNLSARTDPAWIGIDSVYDVGGSVYDVGG